MTAQQRVLRAIGPTGRLYSYERREEFAAVAGRNVEAFFGGPHPAWELRVGDLVEARGPEEVDRVADAGAQFIVTPGFAPDVVDRALERGLAVLPGVATPTEVQAAMRAGLIDEYVLATAPVLVGSGTPFFTTLDDWVDLTLVETRTFPEGVVLTRYETRR